MRWDCRKAPLWRALERVGEIATTTTRARDPTGKETMRHLRRVLLVDVPRYLRRLAVPRDLGRGLRRLTLREWLYALPLLLVLGVIVERAWGLVLAHL